MLPSPLPRTAPEQRRPGREMVTGQPLLEYSGVSPHSLVLEHPARYPGVPVLLEPADPVVPDHLGQLASALRAVVVGDHDLEVNEISGEDTSYSLGEPYQPIMSGQQHTH